MNKVGRLKTYRWQAIHVNGQRIAGISCAINHQELCRQLQLQGIILIHAQRHFNLHLWMSTDKKITRKQITNFITQLATLLEASVPLTVALTIIGADHRHVRLIHLINAIKQYIEQGHSLSIALAKFPEYFDGIDCSLVEAGESSGKLASFLLQLATYQQRMLDLRDKMIRAMYYPGCIAIVAILIASALLTFIVPQFVRIFSSFGGELPMMTILIIELSKLLRQHGLLCASVSIVTIYFLNVVSKRSTKVKIAIDVLLLKTPLITQLITVANLARFHRILALMIEAGIPLLDALRAATKALSNYRYRQPMQQVIDKVTGGVPLNQALRCNPLFSVQICQMIYVGESSGRLVAMFTKIADVQQNRFNQLSDHVQKFLEPLLMMVIAVIVGGLIIALYLPIFKMGGMM